MGYRGVSAMSMADPNSFVTPCLMRMDFSTYRTAELLFGETAAEAYLMSLCDHIALVRRFAKRMFEDIAWLTEFHDASKFLYDEFLPYCWYWHTDRTLGGYEHWRLQYDDAWAHHLSVNPHHWNFWVFDGKPVPMPLTYIKEMICDWHGASKAYTGEWDISDWLNDNLGNITLHAKTEKLLLKELHSIGYKPFSSTNGAGSWTLTRGPKWTGLK